MKAIKDALGIGLGVWGAFSWYFPGFEGVFSEPAKFSTAEGRIIALISLVGGIIIYFMPTDKD